ncbi:MAG: DCC1-like thiol-disulfide oxidoreductase family protein [Anaerolineales bacterium]
MKDLNSAGQLILVFDGDCGFCTLMAAVLRRLDRRGHVRLLACQDPAARELTNVTRSDCLAAAWAFEPSGLRHRGAGAINAALAHAQGWSFLMDWYALPPIGRLEDIVYRGVVWARRWLPGLTPYCQQHPERCPAVRD